MENANKVTLDAPKNRTCRDKEKNMPSTTRKSAEGKTRGKPVEKGPVRGTVDSE